MTTNTFEYWNKTLTYCETAYNTSRLNERAVEIPVAVDWLATGTGCAGNPADYPTPRVLEVGNVLRHYQSSYATPNRRVVDKFEKGAGVENIDVFDIVGEYDFVVAISTVEHVRWDETPRDPSGALLAIDHLRSLLSPHGRLLVTIPLGYHPYLDQAILDEETGAIKQCTLTRSPADVNAWVQDEKPQAEPYGVRTSWASSLWIGEFDHG